MQDENFWPCLDDMVDFLSGNRKDAEDTLDRLEAEVRLLPEIKREELRNDLTIVIGQLARLAMRIDEMKQ